ncbi:Crp/Fnr family transcriptional regulator [Rubrobacter aplysinae]|uniref:Crp/Fnr family transcriptional regulator n=1 Tax=Rubrobacter aplysinae TaxID=909625 RepID=UPI00064C0EBA|nr:Crp/Fnr family transcriptional regulator [Rubrobacter aplysinae]
MLAGESHRVPESPEPEDHASLKEREVRKLLGMLGDMGLTPSRRRYEGGDVIYHEGEYGDALYVVSSGAVRLSRRYEGDKEATLALLGPNDIFGDLVHEATTTQRTGAEAFTECEIFKVPKVFVERASRRDAEVASTLLKLMELELAGHRELMQRLLPRRTEVRVAHLLEELAGRFGIESDGATTIRLRLSHEDLAAMVASTRESVTSAMARLRERGVIVTRNGRIHLLKSSGLSGADSPGSQETSRAL